MRDIEELSDEERHLEERRTKVKDYKERSLTVEERDEIIRKYNADHSIHHITPDVVDRPEDDDIAERTLSEHERADLLQEIHDELISRGECNELVRESISKTSSKNLEMRNNPKKENTESFTEKDTSKLSKSYPLNMWTPEIDSVEIESYEHLIELVKLKSPEFFKRDDSSKLLELARIHLDLFREFRDRNSLEQGEVAELSKRKEMSPTTLKRWFREGAKPRIYYWLNKVPSIEKETLFQVSISGIFIRDIHIESEEILEQIIKEQFPSLTEREDFDRFFNSTKSYLNLVERFSDRESITSQELLELSISFQIPKQIVKGWLCESKVPNLLILLNQALSIDEAANLRADIIEQLNGVTSLEKAQERLENYYLWEKVQSFPKLEKSIEISSRFFRFIDTLSEGGLIADIARRSNNSKRDGRRWVRFRQIPGFALLASMIPSDIPENDYRWLPIKMETGGLGRPREFIQVPIKNLTPERISTVLHQLQPIDNPKIREHEKKFGKLSREHALMYLLGAILSDGRFHYSNSISSASLKLKASKKYEWGIDFGEGFCYCMERVGIERKTRTEGITRQKNGTIVEFNQWKSENTPLVVWIENTLLGLRGPNSKSKTPVKAEWIYSIPHSWKVAFLQGVCDGDGHASIKAHHVGITSVVNVDFLAGLLRSMGIEPTTTEERVLVHKKSSIQILNEFPMFKYASERQEKLSQIVDMFSSMGYGSKISNDTRILIQELGCRGLSSGEIVEKLWFEFSIAAYGGTIRRILREMRTK